jgi:hypothetical protein
MRTRVGKAKRRLTTICGDHLTAEPFGNERCPEQNAVQPNANLLNLQLSGGQAGYIQPNMLAQNTRCPLVYLRFLPNATEFSGFSPVLGRQEATRSIFGPNAPIRPVSWGSPVTLGSSPCLAKVCQIVSPVTAPPKYKCAKISKKRALFSPSFFTFHLGKHGLFYSKRRAPNTFCCCLIRQLLLGILRCPV